MGNRRGPTLGPTPTPPLLIRPEACHVAHERTRVYLFEEDHTTKVRVELDTGTTHLTGHDTARCNPTDKDVPEIGDELATARALENLVEQLKRTAYGDMAAAGAAPRY
ncbi:dsRBD fold-containing protein [Streptomyces goshikiensis]|uniref:dsRBD fold-containing protein n=1 Tax=Streptomyces goshikiensis TaxID=1942 RepID=UPI00371CCE90